MKIKFIGKCLLLEEKGKRVFVIGDLHLGYVGSMRESGILVPSGIYNDMINELDKIFENIGKADKVVLLGDLKHEFGRILQEEWKEVLGFIDYLREKCGEIIVVRGNHDATLDSILKQRNLKGASYFIWENTAFLHGDRDFDFVNGKEIKIWVIGHAHPAVVIEEKRGGKKEKYKCFLDGKYLGKRVIIVPSFFSLNEGTDVRDLSGNDLGLAWNFDLKKFDVKIAGDGLEVLDFGKLKGLRKS